MLPPGHYSTFYLLYILHATKQNEKLVSPLSHLLFRRRVSLPERSGMLIACFKIRMKVVLNVKVSRTVGVGADQDPVETKDKQL